MTHFFFVFLYALLPVLTFPIFFPYWRLTFFAPFLILAYYKKTYISCLWLSILCGLIIDLLSAHTPLGIHSINYCLTTWLLYKQKHHFFEDSLTTLPILAFLFSAFSTLLQSPLMDFIGHPSLISWSWFKIDLIKMSLWDAFYAFVCFTIPSLFLPRAPRQRNAFFLHKIERK